MDGLFFSLAAFQQRGERQYMLFPPTPEPICDCSGDVYNCDDFATQFEAQQCFDSCWVLTGEDLHKLDADGDYVTCESLPHRRLLARADRKAA